MPWKETCAVDQRVALLADWLRDEWTMTELAAAVRDQSEDGVQVGRPVRGGGRGGLVERSRAPHASRARDGAEDSAPRSWRCAARIRTGGRRNSRAILREREPDTAWPAPSTMGELLRREGLSHAAPRLRYIVPLTQPLAAAQRAK